MRAVIALLLVGAALAFAALALVPGLHLGRVAHAGLVRVGGGEAGLRAGGVLGGADLAVLVGVHRHAALAFAALAFLARLVGAAIAFVLALVGAAAAFGGLVAGAGGE